MNLVRQYQPIAQFRQTSLPRLLSGVFVLLVSGHIMGCDALLDAAVDCIDDDRPRFNRDELADPILNQEYREVIQASIKNEPYDDRFIYQFDFFGNLPEGLSTESFGREFMIIGTPVETGMYGFSLRVQVELPSTSSNDDSGLCSTVRTVEYNFDVQLM